MTEELYKIRRFFVAAETGKEALISVLNNVVSEVGGVFYSAAGALKTAQNECVTLEKPRKIAGLSWQPYSAIGIYRYSDDLGFWVCAAAYIRDERSQILFDFWRPIDSEVYEITDDTLKLVQTVVHDKSDEEAGA